MGNLGPLLIMLVFALLLGTFIGAVILRAACALFNKFAGPGGQVTEPDMGKAMGILFLTLIVNFAVSFGLGLAMGAGGQGFLRDPNTRIMANLVGAPVSICVMAVMVTLLLPTSLPRGFAIAGLYLVVAFCVALVIVAIIMGIALALGGFGARR